jgi:hypothetical protein
LGEWLEESVRALGPKDAADIDSLIYLLEFTLIRAIDGGIQFKASRLTAGAGASTSRTRDNTLTVALARRAGDPSPVHVVIDADNRGRPARAAPDGARRSRTPPVVRQRLDQLIQTQRYNSILSPNIQIVPLQ